MSTILDVTPEQLARLIYQYREALAHDIDHEANHDLSLGRRLARRSQADGRCRPPCSARTFDYAT